MATSKPPKAEDKILGMVLYSDGSAAVTNPGYGGWGLHGYAYSDQPPKKGSGNAAQHLTAQGYVDKVTAKKMTSIGGSAIEEIKPLFYLDGYGSFKELVTNNVGELAGAVNALKFALDYDLQDVRVLSDSTYVVKGASEWLPTWKKNNWFKRDGTPVVNRGLWESFDEVLTQLKAKGVGVKIEWLKGHSIYLGNQLADKYATIGNRYSRVGQARADIELKPADGYWSVKYERSPFLSHRRLYFTTGMGAPVPGQYHLGEHGKDDELLGKRQADGAYSFVKLQTPDPLIEMLVAKQTALAAGRESVIMARLDKLFASGVSGDLLRFGDICVHQPSPRRADLHIITQESTEDEKEGQRGGRSAVGEPLTKELSPPRLASRAIEAVNMLHGVLEAHLDPANTSLVKTNLTEVLFEIDDKGAYCLRPEFIVGYSVLDTTARWGVVGAEKTEKVSLYMGIDLPDRNALKRMEALKPQVYVLTWCESETAFRYATAIQAGPDAGIWAGMYSNLRLTVPEPHAILE